MERCLNLHVHPAWGERPIAEITAPEVRKLIAALYAKTPATATNAKQYISRVMEFAWAEDRVPFNPVQKIEVYLPSRHIGDATPQPSADVIEEARAASPPSRRGGGRISPREPPTHRRHCANLARARRKPWRRGFPSSTSMPRSGRFRPSG